MGGLVDLYVRAMVEPREVNGRVTYAPLGGLELQLLVSLYDVRLQTVKSEAVECMRKAHGDVDPRRILPDQLSTMQPEGRSSARVVRVLNVGTNHYQVHLPVPPRS